MAVSVDPQTSPGDKGLQAGALGLVGNVVIGLSAVAPAYSLAATLGYIVAQVHTKAPAMFVIAFIPMLLIAFAHRELGQDTPDCGTTFTWATKAFGPWVGWMGGWGLAVSAIIVLANVAEIAAVYLFEFLHLGGLAENLWAKVSVGCVLIIAMTWVSIRGHRHQRTHPERADRRAVRRPRRRQCHRAGEGRHRIRGPPGDHAELELARPRSPPPSSSASSSTGDGTRAWPSARRPGAPRARPGEPPSSPR